MRSLTPHDFDGSFPDPEPLREEPYELFVGLSVDRRCGDRDLDGIAPSSADRALLRLWLGVDLEPQRSVLFGNRNRGQSSPSMSGGEDAAKRSVVWAALREAVHEPISPFPLATFRVAFGVLILAEFLHTIYMRRFFYLADPLHDSFTTALTLKLVVWFVAIICLIVGLATPVAALIVYRFIVAFFGPTESIIYHADFLYIPAGLLVTILPTNRCLSVDRRLVKRYFGVDLATFPIPRFFNNLVIFWVMGLMYFDSTLYKLESPFWIDGLGFWLPASFPSFTAFSWNALLNQAWLVKLAGYITLVFELVFLFVFWIPKMRRVLLPLGLVLHLGIAIVLPLPLFGLLMVIGYLNFFPDPFLDRIVARFQKLVRKTPLIVLPPLEKRFLRVDQVMLRVLLGVGALVLVGQGMLSFDEKAVPDKTKAFLRRNTGIGEHRVFSEWQFNAMKQEVGLVFHEKATGHETRLPWIDANGHTGVYGYGRFWSFWWLNSLPGPRQREFWARASEAWAVDNGVDLETGYIIVVSKPIISRKEWERDRQAAMEKLPWRALTLIRWEHGQRVYLSVDP